MTKLELLAAIDLNNDDQKELARILGCTKVKLSEKLKPYASAALEEIVSMFLGQRSSIGAPICWNTGFSCPCPSHLFHPVTNM